MNYYIKKDLTEVVRAKRVSNSLLLQLSEKDRKVFSFHLHCDTM